MKLLPWSLASSRLVLATTQERKLLQKGSNEQRRLKGRSNKLFDKIREQGFTQEDIPKAIIFHELLGIFMLALTWSLCYFFPPSQNPYLRQPIQKLQSLLPAKFSSAWSSSEILTSKIGSAYVESSCVRKIIRPVVMPTKVYVTIRYLKWSRDRRLKHQQLHPSAFQVPSLPTEEKAICSESCPSTATAIPVSVVLPTPTPTHS